jgi:hypothetical protein
MFTPFASEKVELTYVINKILTVQLHMTKKAK